MISWRMIYRITNLKIVETPEIRPCFTPIKYYIFPKTSVKLLYDIYLIFFKF